LVGLLTPSRDIKEEDTNKPSLRLRKLKIKQVKSITN
jgi:hypothetical protein